MMFGTRALFDYDQCDACGGLQIRSIPTDLGQYYPPDYYSFGEANESLTTKRRIVLGLRRIQRATRDGSLRALSKLVERRFGTLDEPEAVAAARPEHDARILDVGCGSGSLLRALRDAGYADLTGVDPFIPGPLAYAGGIKIHRAEIRELTGRFDLVMLHHVFEHLPDPQRTLRDIRRLLPHGGQLLLRFPSVPCEAFDRYGRDWVQLDAPRHLHIISRVGLEGMADRAGLRLEIWSQDSGPFQFWGSEQYQRDIPLFDNRSYARDASAISATAMTQLAADACALNARGRGDQSVAVLRAT